MRVSVFAALQRQLFYQSAKKVGVWSVPENWCLCRVSSHCVSASITFIDRKLKTLFLSILSSASSSLPFASYLASEYWHWCVCLAQTPLLHLWTKRGSSGETGARCIQPKIQTQSLLMFAGMWQFLHAWRELAGSWEGFWAFSWWRKMKSPEGSCQFTKWASLSSLPHSHSSAGMDTAPSRFHLLLWLSASNLPSICMYARACVCVRVRQSERENGSERAKKARDGHTNGETDRQWNSAWLCESVRNKAPVALKGFLGVEISRCITYCDLCYFWWGW